MDDAIGSYRFIAPDRELITGEFAERTTGFRDDQSAGDLNLRVVGNAETATICSTRSWCPCRCTTSSRFAIFDHRSTMKKIKMEL